MITDKAKKKLKKDAMNLLNALSMFKYNKSFLDLNPMQKKAVKKKAIYLMKLK